MGCCGSCSTGSPPNPAGVLEIGRGIAGVMAGMAADALDVYVAHTARKRVAFFVEPQRIISWDHRSW
jgi:hypothetical protein